jgi:hypothetical protein
MTAAAVAEIVEPGVYDLPDSVYHADPVPGGSLSSSGARKLLPPSCPAIFHHERSNPREPTQAFDFGHAAHKMVLGSGPEIVLVDRERWDTKEVKAELAEIRERGAVPLKRSEYQQVQDMADALRQHPVASILFDPEYGTAEASLFWRDDPSGIWRRARLDWLPEHDPCARMILPDYKTALSANPAEFTRTAWKYGYHQQAAWYCDAVTALDLTEDPAFVFVVQEKTPPYLVSVIQLDTEAHRIGQHLNRRAIEIYTECTTTDTWPGYGSDVELVALPHWYTRRFEDRP